MTFGPGTWRADVPASVGNSWGEVVGPRLFEETDYNIILQSKTDDEVVLRHRDPTLIASVRALSGGRIRHGTVNFGGQVGISEFSIWVDGKPECDFEVEVFPSKLDYATDYEEMVADVQSILSGLVLEYLRATFRLGSSSPVPQPSDLEWVILLKQLVDELEKAITYIAQHPHWGLIRKPRDVRADRIKRVDSSLRTSLLKGRGSGQVLTTQSGMLIKERQFERSAKQTLDTPEHRWLAHQLRRIRRRLANLVATEARKPSSTRRELVTREINGLEQRIARLSKLEPFTHAYGLPPAGFASLRLLSAPGYREAYRSVLILSLGLRLTGGPVQLSLKDISTLYEYWCYLALVRVVSELSGKPIPPSRLIQTEQEGLRVLLEKGRKTAIEFGLASGRAVEVTYNPRFQGEAFLVAQQPDMLVTVRDPAWPPMQIVLDAKYRLDSSPSTVEQYGSPGPPADAVNVLHRYRDALVEYEGISTAERPKHTVVQAAALFPFREDKLGEFQGSRLWQSLARIGVGALPFLPGGTDYLFDWLRSILQSGGWELADGVIHHRTHDWAQNWRIAASQSVLVGVLRGGVEKEHLEWITKQHLYYMPQLKHQKRQYDTKWVAIYSPHALRRPGAVTHLARVVNVDVLLRREIPTPWKAHQDGPQIVYELAEIIPLDRPIENKCDNGQSRFSTGRWSSKLAIDRATSLHELFLETEPEWRLYEELQAAGIDFSISPGTPKLNAPEDPKGRAWFTIGTTRIQYKGAAGFVAVGSFGNTQFCPDAHEVIRLTHGN